MKTPNKRSNPEQEHIIKKSKEAKRKRYKLTLGSGYSIHKEEVFSCKSKEISNTLPRETDTKEAKGMKAFAVIHHYILDIIMDGAFFSHIELRLFLWIWKETIGRGRYSIRYAFNLDTMGDLIGVQDKKAIRKALVALHDRGIIKLHRTPRKVKDEYQLVIPNEKTLLTLNVSVKDGMLDISEWKTAKGEPVSLRSVENEEEAAQEPEQAPEGEQEAAPEGKTDADLTKELEGL